MSVQQRNLNGSSEIYKKISKFVPENEWKVHAPLIEKINKLKKETNAIILAPSSADTTLTLPCTSTWADAGHECRSKVASVEDALIVMFWVDARYNASSSGHEDPVSSLQDHQVQCTSAARCAGDSSRASGT